MLNPDVPRPIDRWTEVPLEGDLTGLGDAKILAPPDGPALWPQWRAQLGRWRAEARARIGYDGSRYGTEPGDCFGLRCASTRPARRGTTPTRRRSPMSPRCDCTRWRQRELPRGRGDDGADMIRRFRRGSAAPRTAVHEDAWLAERGESLAQERFAELLSTRALATVVDVTEGAVDDTYRAMLRAIEA